MNYDNICKFIPSEKKLPTEINTVNFVLERSQSSAERKIRSVYAMHLVTDGEGAFVLGEQRYALRKGDIFFVLPSDFYAIVGTGELEYAYVSFLGLGAPVLIDRIVGSGTEKIFHGNESLVPFWKNAVESAHADNIDLISRGVLEYSAALLIAYAPSGETTEIIGKIERYVRRYFTDPRLSLKSLSEKFGYNDKYLSKLFHRYTGVYFVDYLTNLRINAACGLIQEGNTSVKEIALSCGFSDPLYFSKVFKGKMCLSPTEFFKQNNRK